ncbi:MAG: hypothetical protein JWM35_1768 [Verrucomicrobia bacterium]|nr:hypothetical protein [Verrucomicrobiota bacterium]
MSDDPRQMGKPDRLRLSRHEIYEWTYELHKLHREFPKASREQILDALETAWEQNSKAPMRDKIESFARGLLNEWSTGGRMSARAEDVGKP